jgi:hypothetical protein
MLPAINIGRKGKQAAANNPIPPTTCKAAAAKDARQPKLVTQETIKGLINKPALPPVAISAFAVDPAWKYRTATSSKNVEPAVSNIPALMARRHSYRKVISLLLAGEADIPCSLSQSSSRAKPLRL